MGDCPGMFNVNFYGRTAAKRERERERGGDFVNKERVHYKSSGTLPFYDRPRRGNGAGAASVRPSGSASVCRAEVYHSSFTFQSAHAQSAAAAAAARANITDCSLCSAPRKMIPTEKHHH